MLCGFLTLEDGTDTFSRNVGNKFHYLLRNNTAEPTSVLLSSGGLIFEIILLKKS